MSIERGHETRYRKSPISCRALIMSHTNTRVWRALMLILSLSLPMAGWTEESQRQPAGKLLLVDEAVIIAVDNNPSLSEMQSRYEALAEIPGTSVHIHGVRSYGESGTHAALYAQHRLDAAGIAAVAKEFAWSGERVEATG